ncbi:MAG: hypothetical protein AAF391_03720 [Bacteroidota bacterium]
MSSPHLVEAAAWSNQPNSQSSKIKVLNAANTFSSLPNGLTQMGYGIVQNTGTYLETNLGQDNIRLKVFVIGVDLVLTSEVQRYTQSEFAIAESSNSQICERGPTTDGSACWRTIQSIANRLGTSQQYQ